MSEAVSASGLYTGVVTHVRHRPRRHALKYRVFMLLIDLDEAPTLLRRSRWIRAGRFGLMSWREADHGDGGDRPLKAQVQAVLADAGISAGGPIRLLTMPRILGHGFNPISVYFCHHADGRLAATLYEVSNTFGQRHRYLVASDGLGAALERHAADKRFYVSPFMDMDLAYRFVLRPPEEVVRLTIEVDDAGGSMLTAAFVGRRSAWTDANLMKAWLGHPLLTLKVVFGIHWEALQVFLKGVGFRHRPPLPPEPVTLGRNLSACQRTGDPHAA